nr:hypothetical protein [Armatimonadota bacterium]
MNPIQLTNGKSRPKAPRLDEVQLRFSDKGVRELEKLLTHYPDKKSAMLP